MCSWNLRVARHCQTSLRVGYYAVTSGALQAAINKNKKNHCETRSLRVLIGKLTLNGQWCNVFGVCNIILSAMSHSLRPTHSYIVLSTVKAMIHFDHGHMTLRNMITDYGKHQTVVSSQSDWSSNAGFKLAIFINCELLQLSFFRPVSDRAIAMTSRSVAPIATDRASCSHVTVIKRGT